MAHEAHSAPAPPLDLDRIKEMIGAAIASFFIRVQFDIGKLGIDLKTRLDEVVAGQEEMQKVDKLQEVLMVINVVAMLGATE